jgi:hypothetical protein
MNEEIQNVTDVTENTEEQTAEEIVDGVELTDTADDTTDVDTEETKEEQPKGRFYTDEEVNSIVDKRVARKMRKYEKQMAEYEDTENVLKSALEVDNISDANKKLRSYYQEQGYELPEKKSSYSERELNILAKAEADEIIEEGYDSMLEEANRLAKIGYQNLNQKEKLIFMTLGDELDKQNDTRELKKIGANEELLKKTDFIEFRNMFDKKTPIEKVYGLYKNQEPKPKVELPGSMKNTSVKEEKEYLTPEEVVALTPEDWEKPGMWEKVRKSQLKWPKE